MKPLRRLLCLASLAGAVALASCAEKEDETFSRYEQMALRAWMELNRPDLVENYQFIPGHEDEGYYVDLHDAGDPDASPVNAEACWVTFDFSGRDLSGNIILSRDASDAVLAGTFTKYTHYVPFYRYCGSENSGLMEGTWLAMRNKLTLGEKYFEEHKAELGIDSREVLLREGSKVTLYLPSRVVGAGVEGDGGYEGQYKLNSRKPFIVTMTVRDTVKNPLELEGTNVDAYCERNGGLQIFSKDKGEKATSDGVMTGMPTDPNDPNHPYNEASKRWVSACDSVAQLYVNYRYRPDETFDFPEPYVSGYEPYKTDASLAEIDRQIAEALVERFHPDEDEPYAGVAELDADSVKTDGTARIWYIGRFLDGFIFDTNIDEVKKIIYGEVVEKGTALSFKSSANDLIAAFAYVVPNLKFGQWAALITTSTYGYGSSGRAGTTSSSSSSTSNGYTSGYLDYLNYLNYVNSYYNDYYGGYYGGYYDNYYGSGYDTSDTGSEVTTKVYTEIPPYAPLIFQFYVEPAEKDD